MSLWMAPMGLHISLGSTADAKALARLHAQGFFRGWPQSDFESYLADPGTTPAYLARDRRGQVHGFAMLRLSGDECELLTIAVERADQGKGLGRALLNAAFADLMMSPVRTMFLEVDETNLPAISLYRRLGFSEIGRREGYYPHADGSKATALVMRADLG